MDPLGNVVADNREYLDRLLNGKMQTVLVVCHACMNVYMTERGPTSEYSSSCCPYCTSPRETSAVSLDVTKIQEKIHDLSHHLDGSPAALEVTDKIRRIMLDGKSQQFNVAVCNHCNNRFIFLEEDFDRIVCCCFCAQDRDDMSALLDYSKQQNTLEYEPIGFDKSIDRLFFLQLANGVEENFILTDIDKEMGRYRFVSVVDDRMALWLRDDDIIQMFEFTENSVPKPYRKGGEPPAGPPNETPIK